MIRGTSIRLFLVDGTPGGLKTAEKSNWTGRALMTSRAQYPEIRLRGEFARPGIYLLRGPAMAPGFASRIYLGEGDATGPRIDSHVKQKDFWTDLIVFTSKDDTLNKAHVKYLESRLLSLARAANRVEIENTNFPQPPALSEADIADNESFLDEMLIIYPVLGVTVFDTLDEQNEESLRLQLSGKDSRAEGSETALGFVVYRDAVVRAAAVKTTPLFVCSLRDRLMKEGVLVQDGKQLRLTQDYLFPSPSTAAAVVMGRNANGRIEWKAENGLTLKEIQEAALSDEEVRQE